MNRLCLSYLVREDEWQGRVPAVPDAFERTAVRLIGNHSRFGSGVDVPSPAGLSIGLGVVAHKGLKSR